MRLNWLTALTFGLLVSTGWAEDPQPLTQRTQVAAEHTRILTTEKEKMSYALGVDTAKNLRQVGMDVDVELLVRGLRDYFSDDQLLMTPRERVATRTALQREMTRQAAERQVKIKKAPVDGQ